MTKKPDNTVTVSDHALVRYMERGLGLDMDNLRLEILTPDRVGAIKAGANKIKVNGLSFVVKDNTIVTVID